MSEETREQFESDPLSLEFISELLMRDVVPNVRRNYKITDLARQEDGQYIATFIRKESAATSVGG